MPKITNLIYLYNFFKVLPMKNIKAVIFVLVICLNLNNVFADEKSLLKSRINESTANTVHNAQLNNNGDQETVEQPKKSKVILATTCDDMACKMVFDTTQQVMGVINQDARVDKILTILDLKFDFQLMTKFAMGNNWKLANKKQQNTLVMLFKQLLINTYSTAWSKFKGAKITIISSQINMVPNNTANNNKQTAIVVSHVLLPNSTDNQPIKVEYDLSNTGVNNSWVAYDIKIADASLITTYRNQFNDIIQNSKVDGLILQLKSKINNLNRKK